MRTLAIASLAALLLAEAGPARPQDPGAPAAPPAPAQTAPEAKPPPAPDLSTRPSARPSLDFQLLEERPGERPVDPAFEAAVASRRKLLSVHQAAGIATWALMGATVAVGQLNYRDLYGGGGYTQRYRGAHRALAGATTASFAFTGILALAAPEPYAKRMRLDTATVHKAAMAVTTLGMVAQIALGITTRQAIGTLRQRDLAAAHQALGYATFGAMTIGAVTLAF